MIFIYLILFTKSEDTYEDVAEIERNYINHTRLFDCDT